VNFLPELQKVRKIFCVLNYCTYFCGTITTYTTMQLPFYNKSWKPVFDVELFLEENKPKTIRSSRFWDDVHLEYDEAVEEFKKFIFSDEEILDSKGNHLKPIEIYQAIEAYKMRILKLMLIFNIRLYKTYNVNKKTGERYIVMRAFWLGNDGKPVRWFSKNLGAESKVAPNGKIPIHLLDSIEEDILERMWDQYEFDMGRDGGEIGYDDDGNIILL
jgi:hypothetical protein